MKYPDLNIKEIYLSSPSFGCATSYYKPRLNMAIKNLEKQGFSIIKGPYIFSEGLLASNPKTLANEFIDTYKNNKFNLSVAGGEVMTDILDYIDFNELKSYKPSWFMGYSDNTNITFLLTTITDVASIYGSCAPEFGALRLSKSNIDHLKLIKGEKLEFDGYKRYEKYSLKSNNNPYASLNLKEVSKITTYPENIKSVEGRFIGGCIDVLSTIVGTKLDNMQEFNKRYDNILFYFEACDMTPVEVYRRLIQFKRAGWFKNTCGFVFGRPLITDNMFGLNYKDYIIRALKDLNLPIIFDLDIGHVKPQIPVINGAIAKINITDNKYNIRYELK